jgi:hypothetical protein
MSRVATSPRENFFLLEGGDKKKLQDSPKLRHQVCANSSVSPAKLNGPNVLHRVQQKAAGLRKYPEFPDKSFLLH